MKQEHALQRVTLCPLDGFGSNVLSDLENFHLTDAKAYDPNEETRLRKVIGAVGEERFNTRIRALATSCRTRISNHTGNHLAQSPLMRFGNFGNATAGILGVTGSHDGGGGGAEGWWGESGGGGARAGRNSGANIVGEGIRRILSSLEGSLVGAGGEDEPSGR